MFLNANNGRMRSRESTEIHTSIVQMQLGVRYAHYMTIQSHTDVPLCALSRDAANRNACFHGFLALISGQYPIVRVSERAAVARPVAHTIRRWQPLRAKSC